MSNNKGQSAWRRLMSFVRSRLAPWEPAPELRAGETSNTLRGDRARLTLAKRAEDAVARHLFWRGYRLLARNLRNRYGELDIVAQRGRLLLFVEVRSYREGGSRPAVRLPADKKRRLRRAASRFVARRRDLRDLRRVPCLAEIEGL